MVASLIEFRILTGFVDALGEERFPLALVHWDGRQLRYALREAFPNSLDDLRRTNLRRSLRALGRRLGRVDAGPSLDLGLVHLFPIREGDAGGTAWSTIRQGVTSDPEAHFDELVAALRLTRPERESVAVDWRDVSVALSSLAEQLRQSDEARDLVVPRREVRGFDSFESPVSWKNGRWNNTLAFVPTAARKYENVRRIASLFELAVPATENLVVVYANPADASVRDEFLRGIEWIRSASHAGARLDAIEVPLDTMKGVDVSPVAVRIEHAVSSDHD